MTAFLGKKNILFVMALVLLLSSIGSVSATAVMRWIKSIKI